MCNGGGRSRDILYNELRHKFRYEVSCCESHRHVIYMQPLLELPVSSNVLSLASCRYCWHSRGQRELPSIITQQNQLRKYASLLCVRSMVQLWISTRNVSEPVCTRKGRGPCGDSEMCVFLDMIGR